MRYLAILPLLWAVAATAQGPDTSVLRTSGRVSAGPQVTDNNTNSSKLTEYRDLRSKRVPVELRFNALDPSGFFLGVAGDNITRRDQTIGLRAGKIGSFRLDLGWNEIPHNLSNKALTPYAETSPGVLDVPAVILLPFKKLAPSAAETPQVLRSDTLIAAFAQAYARPIDLANQTKRGTVGIQYTGVEGLNLSAGYTLRLKSGSHPSFGPIGDRPPRTLNIQLAEPIDYRTGDAKVGAEYDFGPVQARGEYLFSAFNNDIDALVWRNVYASPAAGSQIDTWDRLVSAYGRRATAPDNTYQNGTFTGGVNLPVDSRLTASISIGRLRQNQSLLPYSFAPLTTLTLPRETADARMNTMNVTAEYAIVPIRQVSLRAFFRRFELDNETPTSQWQYVTSDVANMNGSVTFLNKRINEPIAWNRRNAGLDATWRLGLWRSNVGLGFEREDIGRERREVEKSVENILRANASVKPARWLSVRGKYLRGDRTGDTYDWRVPRESYWYTLAEAGSDNNNPQFTFENHPDMRRFDLADRKRDQVDLIASLTPGRSTFSISTTFRYRHDDYDSDVTPVQPLLGRSLADSLATTPGDQLGLLNSQRRQFGLDLFYAPIDRLSLSGSLGWDAGDGRQRGLEFNENNKQNPSAIATATLGPWTRAGNQWVANTRDKARYYGVGASYELRANATVSANYTGSIGRLDIDYDGFGVTNYDGTPLATNNEFSFTTPPTVRHDSHVADVRLDVSVTRDVTMRLAYMYDHYRMHDWQQDDATLQFEPVLTDLLLRDTSRSLQWGNRLLNMGTDLASGYTAHVLHVGLTYHF